MVEAQDASAYASREDRNIILAKGGSFSWDSGTGTLTWSAGLEVLSPISGFRMTLSAGSATLADGQWLYVVLTRAPVDNLTLSSFLANSIPNTNDAYAICIRRGTEVYFRNGQKLVNGETRSIFSSGSQSGQKEFSFVWGGGRETHNSDTPLIVGGFALNPSIYTIAGATLSIAFRALAANGDPAITTHAVLYSVTDAEVISDLPFTTTSIVKDEAVLVIGSGAGQVDNSEKIYEVRIYLGAPSGGPTHNIELYSCEVRVVNTYI